MTNEIDVLKRTVFELENAVLINKSNRELFEEMKSSAFWIITYAEKHNITLRNKDSLLRCIQRGNERLQCIASKSSGNLLNTKTLISILDDTQKQRVNGQPSLNNEKNQSDNEQN
ncbi:MAG: hypothetical protein QW838_08185, partial [Candidatus Nitrosotenuis sp.]